MGHTVNISPFKAIDDSVEFDFEAAKLDFALEVKRLMDQRDLKNVDLADLLEVSRPMISKLLRGDANVTLETMVKASRALGGKLLVKIVRENCTPRVFEIAKSESARRPEPQSWLPRIKGGHLHDWKEVVPSNTALATPGRHEPKFATA